MHAHCLKDNFPAARLPHCAAGPVPADLARQPNLAFLDLSHNQLSGSLHAFGAALTGSNNLLQVGGDHHWGVQEGTLLCECFEP
jgi:hypothetical protein